MNARKKTRDIECQLWIDGRNAHAAFVALLNRKVEIQAALGADVQFDDEATNRCKIYQKAQMNVTNRDEWGTITAWLQERGEAYVAYFEPLIRSLRVD